MFSIHRVFRFDCRATSATTRGGGLGAALVLVAALAACRTQPYPQSALHFDGGSVDHGGTTDAKGSVDQGGGDLANQLGPVDILFVVNSEPGTRTIRERLRAAAPALWKRLAEKVNDWHVGFVTADLGTGKFAVDGCTPVGDAAQLNPSQTTCGQQVPRFLAGSFNTASNFLGDPAGFFAGCYLGRLDQGCGYQQPWRAAYLALDEKTNPGFLRAGGRLMVVLVSDTEDCSVDDNSDLFDETKTAYGPPSDVRCFMQGASCATTIKTNQSGLYTDCRPAAGQATPKLASAPQLYVDIQKRALSQGKVRVDFFAITANTGTVQISDDPQVGLSSVPVCQLGQQEAALPSVRIDQIGKTEPADKVQVIDTVCDSSWTNTLDEIGRVAGTEPPPSN